MNKNSKPDDFARLSYHVVEIDNVYVPVREISQLTDALAITSGIDPRDSVKPIMDTVVDLLLAKHGSKFSEQAKQLKQLTSKETTKYDQMRDELSKLTMKELKQIAKDEGICLGYAGATKRETVNEIISQRSYREREGI